MSICGCVHMCACWEVREKLPRKMRDSLDTWAQSPAVCLCGNLTLSETSQDSGSEVRANLRIWVASTWKRDE